MKPFCACFQNASKWSANFPTSIWVRYTTLRPRGWQHTTTTPWLTQSSTSSSVNAISKSPTNFVPDTMRTIRENTNSSQPRQHPTFVLTAISVVENVATIYTARHLRPDRTTTHATTLLLDSIAMTHTNVSNYISLTTKVVTSSVANAIRPPNDTCPNLVYLWLNFRPTCSEFMRPHILHRWGIAIALVGLSINSDNPPATIILLLYESLNLSHHRCRLHPLHSPYQRHFA